MLVLGGSVISPRLFVGRQNELATFRSVLGGDARLLLVVGDAGVGKTRWPVTASDRW